MRRVYSVQLGNDGLYHAATGAKSTGTMTIHEAKQAAREKNGTPTPTIEVAEKPPVDILLVQDFDKGFGIGGLSRYIEPVTVPTVRAIKRVEKRERKMETCRRCGASDLVDGAMFTTMAGSGYCDDCC